MTRGSMRARAYGSANAQTQYRIRDDSLGVLEALPDALPDDLDGGLLQ
jgi:hypothetical protein